MNLKDLRYILEAEAPPLLPADPHPFYGWNDSDGDGIPDRYDDDWYGGNNPYVLDPVTPTDSAPGQWPWEDPAGWLEGMWEDFKHLFQETIPNLTLEDLLELLVEEGIYGLLYKFPFLLPLYLDDNVGGGDPIDQRPEFVDGFYPGLEGWWFYNPDFSWDLWGWPGYYDPETGEYIPGWDDIDFPNPWDPDSWGDWQVIAPPYGPPNHPDYPGIWPPPEGYDPYDSDTWNLPPGWDPDVPFTWDGEWYFDPDSGEWIPVDLNNPGWTLTDEGWVWEGDGPPGGVTPDGGEIVDGIPTFDPILGIPDRPRDPTTPTSGGGASEPPMQMRTGR